jgi:nitrile hydratase
MGATGAWNLDMARCARETLPDYDALSYYAIWVKALQQLMIERDLIGEDEVAAGRMLRPPRELARMLRAGDVDVALRKGSPTERRPVTAARFALGERVRTRLGAVPHHTRLPGYARGKVGRIEHVRGVHVFADAHAQGLGEQPQWLYTVVFDGKELWGDDVTRGHGVSIDVWEPYLERV